MDVKISSPLLPLRDIVVFPSMVIPLFVGRAKSIKAMEMSMEGGQHILLATQRNASQNEPSYNDLYRVGCVANILQMLNHCFKARAERGVQILIIWSFLNIRFICVSRLACVSASL